MKLQSTDRTVGDILNGNFLVIPRFQRPYSWERENVEDFWNDAVTSSKPSDYFIGSVVMYTLKPQESHLVDGQQRFTTITITICAIRDLFLEHGESELASGTGNLIARSDINNKSRLVLDNKTSSTFLHNYVQAQEKDRSTKPDSDEDKRIKSAYDLLYDKIKADLENQVKGKVREDAILRTKIARLKELRDHVLSLRLIEVTLDKEVDAYTIFETLNAKGLDLRLSDLVKSHILNLIPANATNHDATRDEWDKMMSDFEKTGINASRFLHHFYLSRYPYTAEKNVYKYIKRKVTKKNVSEFWSDLKSDSEYYMTINEPTRYSWGKPRRGILDSLQAISMFRVRQPMPMLLALTRAYMNKNISKKVYEQSLTAIECFQFIFTAVVSARGSGGIAQLYATRARSLSSETDSQKRTRIVNDMISKLQDSKPNYEEFEANFVEIFNSKRFTKNERLSKYILRKYHRHNDPNRLLDFDSLTVEHIRSQSSAANAESHQHVAMLGNQILVPEDVNAQQLKDKSFESKRQVLASKNFPVWVDKRVLDASAWNNDAIVQRTKEMAKLSYERIWTF